MAHNLLNHFQSRLYGLHVSAILRGAFSRLLGKQPTQFLLVLKPAPEPDPKHRKERNPEDRFNQECFLVGEDVDKAVIHTDLPRLHRLPELSHGEWCFYDGRNHFRIYVLVKQYSNAVPAMSARPIVERARRD
jgi:hypothetical protein